MRKVIYGIGSIFLAIGIVLIFFAGSSFFVNDPYNLSESEFLKIYNNKKAYSYTYLNKENNIIFLCLDKNVSKEDDKRAPKCKGHRRYVKLSKLNKALADKILGEIN